MQRAKAGEEGEVMKADQDYEDEDGVGNTNVKRELLLPLSMVMRWLMMVG